MNLLTTNQAAEELGVTRQRIVALIVSGRLPAEKAGRDYMIRPADLDRVRDRKPGRPKAPERKRKGKPRG